MYFRAYLINLFFFRLVNGIEFLRRGIDYWLSMPGQQLCGSLEGDLNQGTINADN